MSEQEKKTGGSSAGGSVVMVEQTTGSRHKPYRPTDLQEEPPDLHHKRSRAPAVPSVTEELKDSTDGHERKECEYAVSSEKHKQSIVKKFSSTKKRGSSPETITLAPLEVETKPQPIPTPPLLETAAPRASSLVIEKVEPEKKADDDSITEEIPELRTPEEGNRHSEWSDDEEAGGLPRSDSRASRVSRVMRQLFCCGVRYETPSEDNVSPRPGYTGI